MYSHICFPSLTVYKAMSACLLTANIWFRQSSSATVYCCVRRLLIVFYEMKSNRFITILLSSSCAVVVLRILLATDSALNVIRRWRCRFHDEEHANLLNSMWLTAITFLCVGYGDIVPNTYCGRGITLTCGMVVSKVRDKIRTEWDQENKSWSR